VQLDEALHGLEQPVAQTALMRAARAGRYQVHIALAHRLTVFGEGHAPGGTLAFGKAVVSAVGKTLALKQGDHGVAVQGLLQVVAQTTLVNPSLRVFGLFVHQRDTDARHEHGFAAQQVRELGHGQRG
jgi:hypothetical protein